VFSSAHPAADWAVTQSVDETISLSATKTGLVASRTTDNSAYSYSYSYSCRPHVQGTSASTSRLARTRHVVPIDRQRLIT